MIHHTANWVGYSWVSSTRASAQFRTPTFRSLSPGERANKTGMAVWVGLGVSPNIEQVGIYDYVSPTGKIGWFGLYQLVPGKPVAFGGPISQGDLIRASVVRNGFRYTLMLQDVGHWSISVTKTFRHIENTAEAIVESYSYSGVQAPVTNFAPLKIDVSGVPRDKWITSWATAYVTGHHQIEVKHA
jgi:hypothetical protein